MSAPHGTILIAGGLLASVIAAGCALNAGPSAPAAVQGGCGPTQVFSGPGPDAVGPDAVPGLTGLACAEASPGVGLTAYFFRPAPSLLVVQPGRFGPDNKVLWVSQSNVQGSLEITAHPAGVGKSSIFQWDLPAEGRTYPSLIDLPTPGCWVLTIGSGGASIELIVVSDGDHARS